MFFTSSYYVKFWFFCGVVCEYCNNRSLRLYQQAGPGDHEDGELAQQDRACVNVVFITWENSKKSTLSQSKTKDVQVYKNSPSLCTTNIDMHIHIFEMSF
jgi:hypothetical protein